MKDMGGGIKMTNDITQVYILEPGSDTPQKVKYDIQDIWRAYNLPGDYHWPFHADIKEDRISYPNLSEYLDQNNIGYCLIRSVED